MVILSCTHSSLILAKHGEKAGAERFQLDQVQPVAVCQASMKFTRSTMIAFVLGIAISAAVTSLILLRFHNRQNRLQWISSLDQHLRIARDLHHGDTDKVRHDLDKRLPGLVHSVNTFGQDEFTTPVLRSASEYFRETGKPVPGEISSILTAP